MSLSAFRLDFDADGVAILTFDTPGSKANTLGQAVIAELAERIAEIEARSGVTGLLLQSGKPGMFIAGADLKELGDAQVTPETTRTLVQRGLALIARIERLPFPTVALIDGPCVGGGLELALGFDDRLAGSHTKTELGLPETKIGLIPGWGGTQRLSRLIGPHLACEMICTGDSANAGRAREIGLVFDVVTSDTLVGVGMRRLAQLRQSGDHLAIRARKQKPVGLTEEQLEFTFGVLHGQVAAKTKGHFPAPLAAIDVVRRSCNLTLNEGLAIETEAFVPLVGSPISRNLIALFFQNQRLAKDPGVADASIVPKPIGRVGVIGAGLMGAGIAGAHVRRGVPAVMIDVSAAVLEKGAAAIAKVLHGNVDAGRMKAADMIQAMSRLSLSERHQSLEECDLVVEAIVENEAAKTALFKTIAPHLKKDAILASNTSTISITRMSSAAPDASRFAGLHFFNPVDRMPLVEVIRGEATSDETVATLVALVKKLGKSPIVVKDCPGFLVNRVLFPYLNEAIVLLGEGVEPRAIDAAATAFGMPMGPITLTDVVGIDTCLFAGDVLAKAYADRAATSPILGELLKAGRLGQKTGAGFYRYERGPKGLDDPAVVPLLDKHRGRRVEMSRDDIIDRLMLPMVGEASRLVEEGIVRDVADVDMGLILGIGFPTFRGGLLRWADSLGWDEVCRRMDRFASLGVRFEPTQSMRDVAAAKRRLWT
jgi:3-hydroxyacyl-CoA dehydrogenase/enoyl-CoA hydratase/3-hydroxybutyryl-CoA epimerase/enoyl-CoA isomerase